MYYLCFCYWEDSVLSLAPDTFSEAVHIISWAIYAHIPSNASIQALTQSITEHITIYIYIYVVLCTDIIHAFIHRDVLD